MLTLYLLQPLRPLYSHAVLSWLNFTVTLSALAAGLLNFGDRIGRISAAMFSFVGECPSAIL